MILGCVLSLVCAQDLAASTVSATSVDAFDQSEHDKVCCCGPKCRKESCCCGPVKSPGADRPSALPEAPVATDPQDGTNPCLRGAPCHDPAMPVGPAVELLGKAAACALCDGLLVPPDPGQLLPNPPPGPTPAGLSSRLERPPRTPAGSSPS
ncbi:MAG: hypothetical protein U0835_13145 [Isosphaeraceae bacterium]